MIDETKFVDVDIAEKPTKVFLKSVWLKPKTDLKPYKARTLHITGGVPTRNCYKPSCMSWDRVTGIRKVGTGDDVTTEEFECEGCEYVKGKSYIDSNGKQVDQKCNLRYIIFAEHPEDDKQFAISLNFGAQKAFSAYRKTLLKRGIEVFDVLTNVTCVMAEKGNGTSYTFEFDSELDLNMTDEEEELLNKIKAGLIEDSSVDRTVNSITNFIVQMSENEIDAMRARRLAESICKNGVFVVD